MALPERQEYHVRKEAPDNLKATEEKINEIESWLDKLEKTVQQQQTPTDQNQTINPATDDGQIGDDLIQNKKPIILPLDKKEIETGLHQPVTTALRWLAEWSIKMIKMYHNRVRYPAPAI